MPIPDPLDCPKTGCHYKTPAHCPDWTAMLHMLDIHTATEHGTTTVPATASSNNTKLERLPRPSFDLDMSQAEWLFTLSQWQAYISQSVVSEQVKVQQLKAACEGRLLRRVYDAGDFETLTTEALLLDQMKRIAVRVVHKTLHLQNMWAMSQGPEETIRAYCSRLVGTAELCDLTVTCSLSTCTQKTSYRDQVVMQALLRGMHDKDIRTRVLSRTQNSELKELSAVVDYIAAEEASSASFSALSESSTIAGQSTYRQQHQNNPRGDQVKQDKCGYCGGKHVGDNSPSSRKQHCKAYEKKCSKCERLHHFASVCRSNPKPASAAATTTPKVDSDNAVTGALITSHSFYAMVSEVPTNHSQLYSYAAALSSDGPVTTIPLPHMVHSVHHGWVRQDAQSSPTLLLHIKLDREAYSSLRLPVPRSCLRARHIKSHRCCLDTGAQLCTIPVALLALLGLKEEDLFPIATHLKTVTNTPVDLIGGILLVFTGVNPQTGVTRSTRQLVYVSRSVPYPFLSREACADLGTVPVSFPAIGSCAAPAMTAAATASPPHPCTNTGVPRPDEMPCSCPPRQPPPATPPTLPCAPTKDNLPKLKQYILDRYAASAFNRCEMQPLPLMDDSPPLRLFVDEEARPVAIHTPAAVPAHWAAQVQAGLERDVRLGVLERVPVNTPVKWCSRMLITPKSDGSPRRVVDFQPVNAHCPRQTHHTKSPWQIASSIPPGTCKTVLDAWNGYHSVPIHPADRHLTTFITPHGRYRYKTAPQGLLCAGDGYTQRGDEIIGNFPNHLKCVDDSIIWSEDVEKNFFATCSFLDKCSSGGMVFNSSKFQFGEEEVHYLGFFVTKEGLKPTPEFLENIRSFPTPRSTTDVRSWFGCVNQIAYTFAVSEVMLPFRQLLRPQVPFSWSEELEAAFRESKEEIIRQCERGVKLFNLHAPTGLATDWSKNCIGWWLVQKHCKCPGPPTLGCCKSGWITVYCGSKFNTPAESRYPPIEGEGFAAVHGLEKCSPFILGHPNLLLALDHKPLIRIFGNASLESITNPRLFSFKQKTLRFRFTPVHVPGKKHVVPDAFSRRPDDLSGHNVNNVLPEYSTSMGPPDWVSSPVHGSLHAHYETEEYVLGAAMARLEEFNNPVEQALMAAVSTTPVQAVTWSMLESACQSCPEYRLLHNMVMQGPPEQSQDWDTLLLPFYRHRHLLTVTGPVVLINERPVVPKPLRSRVIDHFHAGHPGLNTMCIRLSHSLYWPSYKEDLTKAKLSCPTCMAYAPSTPAMPPSPPVAPEYPFQSVVCDFFTISGLTYAALADRYSNWLSVLRLKRDTSAELISALRNYFATFGIAETFSSDGASIFTSATFQDFCARWGIQQRISSAYFPQSNKRAEVAVKHAKRMVRDSLGPGGTLDTDALARALLAHRNTPDQLTGLSPAQVIFGRQLRDFLPCSPGRYNPRPEWRLSAEQRELAHAKRHIKTEEKMTKGSKMLPPLTVGESVAIQDQSGNTPRRWSKTGKVLESLGHDSYLIKVDGASRTTQRNRQFLRVITPYAADVDTPATPWAPVSSVPTVDHVDPVEEQVPGLELPEGTVPTFPQAPLPDIVPAQAQSAAPPTAPAQAAVPPTAPVPVPPTGPGQLHQPRHHAPPYARQFTPPPPGVNHYEVLRRMEMEARRQVEASKTLSAQLAYMTNQALSSSVEGGIYGYQPTVSPSPTYQLLYLGQPPSVLPNQMYLWGAGDQS